MINVNPDTKLMIIIADFSGRKTGADDALKSPDFLESIRPDPLNGLG